MIICRHAVVSRIKSGVSASNRLLKRFKRLHTILSPIIDPIVVMVDKCYLVSDFLFMHLPGGGGVLPYMGYIGMCHCEGHGFQAVYSRMGGCGEFTLV